MAVVEALLAAGAVGPVVARRATFAAEIAGCQVDSGLDETIDALPSELRCTALCGIAVAPSARRLPARPATQTSSRPIPEV